MTILASQELVRFGAADRFQVFRIPLDRFSRSKRYIAEQHGFREGTGVGEGSGRLSVPFACFRPLQVVVVCRFRFDLEVGELLGGQEHGQVLVINNE